MNLAVRPFDVRTVCRVAPAHYSDFCLLGRLKAAGCSGPALSRGTDRELLALSFVVSADSFNQAVDDVLQLIGNELPHATLEKLELSDAA